MGKNIFSIMVLAVLLGSSDQVQAEGSQSRFTYGSDCSLLAYLSHQEMGAMVHPLNAENFERFCVARGVYSCADYTPLLDGLGELEDNGVLGCRYLPHSPAVRY